MKINHWNHLKRYPDLEQSLHEKDSIIDKLSRELQRAGESIEAMSVKLQGMENHPQNHLAGNCSKYVHGLFH